MTRRPIPMIRIAALAATLAIAVTATAQPYPAKPVRLVVPYPPGATTDTVARIYANRLGELFGQPIVVENRASGGTLVGTRFVAQAAPDGYTLLFGASAVPLNILMYRKAGYRYEDFVPVTPIGQIPFVLLISSAVPATTVGELVAYGKANPGKLNYVAIGRGSGAQLLTARFLHAAGLNAVEVLYNGGAPATRDLAGGNVQLMIAAVTQANLATPNTRPVGLTGEVRNAMIPAVATFKEAGFPGVIGAVWYGIFAPAATPADVRQKVSRDTQVALKDVAPRMAASGLEPIPGRVEDFPALIRRDTALWEADIKRMGIVLDE